jgi:hypothetical protein
MCQSDRALLCKKATATSCTSGVKVAGWTISSVHGTIFGDSKIETCGERLSEFAGCSVQMPEMPFTSSLELKHESGFSLYLGENKVIKSFMLQIVQIDSVA